MKTPYLTSKKKADCFGCTACVSVCPTKALVMSSDDEGYSYPILYADKCIDCSLCEKVCPIAHSEQGECIDVIAAKAKTDEDRYHSTSGGIFPIMANSILTEGGMVAGAVFDNNFSVIHLLSDKKEDMERMRGSKYVQTRLDDIFNDILDQLKTRKILFTGTPCQCDGLRLFLKAKNGNMKNLILCDLICGKVPSPKIWEDYVQYLEEKFSGNLTSFTFRSKTAGWQYPFCQVSINHKDISREVDSACTWMQIYTSASLCRPSCYACQYTRTKRTTDITIGDFWGCEKTMPQFTDNKGISLVLIHSEKGKQLIEKIKCLICWQQTNEMDCLQERLQSATTYPSNREIFWQSYFHEGIHKIVEVYGKRTFFMKLIYKTILPFTRKIRLYDFILKSYNSLKK